MGGEPYLHYPTLIDVIEHIAAAVGFFALGFMVAMRMQITKVEVKRTTRRREYE